MKYLSICSGIESASVAWHSLGWKPMGFSEIDPFACAVLSHRFPTVPNYGSMLTYKEWPIEKGDIDLIVAGCPCQSFSVAGLRRGLQDPRGNLTLALLGLIERFGPRWVVYENVPGLLSSNGGRDFGSFLGALGELGYGWSYRVLDAQWCRVDGWPKAVPQRRRRVFVVGCLGDRAAPARVLFERESVQRDPAPRGGAGEEASGDAREGAAGGGLHETVGALCADTHPGCYSGQDAYTGRLIPQLVAQEPVPYDLYQITAPVNRQRRAPGDPCHTLARDNAAHAAVVQGVDLYNHAMTGDVAATVTEACGGSNTSGPKVIGFVPKAPAGSRGVGAEEEMSPTVTTHCMAQAVATPTIVRRITPRECERLQGFPDDWTLVPYRGKPAKDGPRYRAIGNSMAANCMAWIGRRIDAVDKGTPLP